MSDPKRATLITVGASKSEKNKVNKTVRLTINLDESNESKYPELNYKELLIAEERKQIRKVENGKTDGLNPFSDNDDDVERVARKFEQKYGGKSTYGRKGRSKHDEFADIGAGYDENDSFIDNTDGYDEMIPPECDTLYGGFYINSGSLEFKTVDPPPADDDPRGIGRRNKRRISSSSSEEESSESSSESESIEEKEPKAMVNGTVPTTNEHRKKQLCWTNSSLKDVQRCTSSSSSSSEEESSGSSSESVEEKNSHVIFNDTAGSSNVHQKKKNKKSENKKAKKVRRTDSSAATSGKQTSDDNVHADGESADSRTSQSDSLTSKPAPSSENPVTSDSSRDMEAKAEVALPSQVSLVLEELEGVIARARTDRPNMSPAQTETLSHPHVFRLERALCECGAGSVVRRVVWTRAARALHVSRTKLLQRAQALAGTAGPQTASSQPASNSTHHSSSATAKRKADDDLKDFDPRTLTDVEKEAKIVDTLQRLKALIDERKPSMMANYNAECERVQEERKKIQIASAAEGAPQGECTKRMPKRRFPWCPKSRALLSRLVKLAKDQDSAAQLLMRRALPLFPSGFVRMPTLLRQADLHKELKVTDIKRPRINSSSQPYPQLQPTSVIQPTPTAGPTPSPAAFPDLPHFPSSLTVTTVDTSPEKTEVTVSAEEKAKTSGTLFGNIYNMFSLNKDLQIEKQDEKKKDDNKNDDSHIPPDIGSITITPVPANTQKPDKKPNNVTSNDKQKQPEGLIRIKSPAALNEMVQKSEKTKVVENTHKKDIEVVNKPEKAKTVENTYKRDTNESSQKHEKAKALENIHKRDINDASHRTDKPKTVDVDSHHHRKETHEKNRALDNIHRRDKDKHKKDREKSHHHHHSSSKDKSVHSPLHIDTNFQSKPKEPTPSPKSKDEVVHKTIETMKIDERNIPRPALIPVHHSPTFAKPDKRPPEVKKKKEVVIISDMDPLSEPNEPVAIDDSSSDVEVVEEKSVNSESVAVPLNNKSLRDVRKEPSKDGVKQSDRNEKLDEATKEDFDSVMKNLKDLEQHSQESPKFNTSSYGGVITSAKRDACGAELPARTAALGGTLAAARAGTRTDTDKLANFFEQNGWM